MRNICKVCKCEKRRVFVKYYMGVKDVWQCKCGNRLIADKDPEWVNVSVKEKEE